jgi:branched-chain amino acid transport system substrate-binding protein
MKIKYLLVAIFLFVFSQSTFAQENGEIVLGAAVSLTGKYTTDGEHTRNGYNLAVKLINESGGVKVGGKSYKMRVIYYDDESTPARAAQLAERLIQQDKVKYMLGPYSSGLTKAIAPVTEKYKIPMIEANGASRALFTKGYRYLFAMLTTADQYLSSSIDLIASQVSDPKKIRLALAFENDTFSQDVRLGVIATAEKYGMKIVIDDKLPKTLDDMAPTLNKVRALRPDMLLVSGHAKGAATAARQIEQFRVNVKTVAMTHCDSAVIEKKIPKGAEYTLCARQWQKQLTYKDDDGLFGNGFDFARIFEAEFGYDPPYQSAESAAALQVWRNAFERANSFDTEVLRDAIASTQMQTFYGNVKFDDAGRNIAKPMVTSQILGGDYKVVAPEKWAATKVVFPRPKWSER